MPEPTFDKKTLVDSLVKQVGLKPEDAHKAIDHIISELTFAKAGRLLADQACQSCGGGAAKQQ